MSIETVRRYKLVCDLCGNTTVDPYDAHPLTYATESDARCDASDRGWTTVALPYDGGTEHYCPNCPRENEA